jgi:nitrite reductase (NO-forming)
VYLELTAKEVVAEMAPGVTFNYWTFDGKVPGPFFRVREGDTVTLTLHNDSSSLHHHNIDLHAVTGPGGGADVTMVAPGESASVTFKALHPGLFVYHCATPNTANHMTHGMYGLILVEPEEGLPKVDHEYYVMQGEFYATGSMGRKGLQLFDAQAMLDGRPTYIVFNGKTDGIEDRMRARTGESARIYFGNGGVNLTSSLHLVGQVFDTVYSEGSLASAPLESVQTTSVPAGGAAVVDFTPEVPGNYVLVDHALARMDKGAWGRLIVTGDQNKEVFDGLVRPGHEHSH